MRLRRMGMQPAMARVHEQPSNQKVLRIKLQIRNAVGWIGCLERHWLLRNGLPLASLNKVQYLSTTPLRGYLEWYVIACSLSSLLNLFGCAVGKRVNVWRKLAGHRPLLGVLPSNSPSRPYQSILFPRIRLLYYASSYPEHRGTSEGPLANAEPPYYHRWSHRIQLLYSFIEAWLRHPRSSRLVRHFLTSKSPSDEPDEQQCSSVFNHFIISQLAKMSKYLAIPLAPDVLFVIFLVSWFITRQVLLLKIVLAVTFDMPKQLDLIWDPSRERYVTYNSCLFFAISLWLLYAMLCVWFWMGCKVAYNVVRGQGAEDTRSDGEERFVQSSFSKP